MSSAYYTHSPEVELLRRIPPHEQGARSPREVYHALTFITQHKAYLIPSHGLAYNTDARAKAFNTAAELKRYANRAVPPNFLLKCEEGDPFVCVRIPDNENLEELEKVVGRIDTVTIMSDDSEAFFLFRAPTRATAYDFMTGISDTRSKVSRVCPLPGAMCRRTNRQFQYARFLAAGEIKFASIAMHRLGSFLPKKSGTIAPVIYRDRSPQAHEQELDRQRERRRIESAARKAAAAKAGD